MLSVLGKWRLIAKWGDGATASCAYARTYPFDIEKYTYAATCILVSYNAGRTWTAGYAQIDGAVSGICFPSLTDGKRGMDEALRALSYYLL